MSILETITYNVLKLLKKCFSIIPINKRYKLSLRLAGLLYHFTNLRKNQARKNIKIAFPSWSDKKIENILKKNYQFFCYNLIQFIAFPKSWENINIAVSGKEILDSYLERKKGVIFISGHFGAWEILGKWVAEYVDLFTGVAQIQKNKGAHRFFIEQRELPGTKHIFKKEPLEKMYNILSKNGILGLVSDQDAKQKGVFVKFFNKLASTPKGAAMFHLNSEAPLLFGICIRKSLQNYEIQFSPIDTSKKSLKHITQSYTSLLESYIKQYPEQYFWFHRRWKTTLKTRGNNKI